MASILTTAGKLTDTKGVFGSSLNTPIYLQFVPGECCEVITSKETLNSFNDPKNVSSIYALPHITKGVKKKRTSLTDSDRYFPLMRGFVDVPAKGDPVLLCKIGGTQYYLGPLNTDNSVNFNVDRERKPEINLSGDTNNRETNKKTANGESRNFVRRKFHKMSKKWNPKLDGNTVFNETHGDLMLEGRHGNSIRVGSRSDNPYIFISNGRQATFSYESLADGSLVAITKNGSLNQHFGGYYIQPDPDDIEGKLNFINGFVLASDLVIPPKEPPNRLMSKLVSSVNGDVDANDLIYNFGRVDISENPNAVSPRNNNQMLFYSDRIIINSKTNDIYLSSSNDIHIGTKRHLTISTADSLIIESERTNLGDPNKKEMDNLVLGKKLQTALKSIVNIFEKITILTQMGETTIGKSPSYKAVSKPAIDKALSDIDTILSNKHFIEEN
tara:strand:- start:58 stop:1383 length:1326 start_codon:yes stop_codon:yes gene_type:complete